MSMNEDEIIMKRTEISRQSRDPNNIKTSVEQVKDLGNAVTTDRAFYTVARAFEMFLHAYGSRFSELSQSLTRWQGHHATWKTILGESRNVAVKTSAEYRRFNELYLIFVKAYETKEHLKEAIEALMEFSRNSNTEIPFDFDDEFKILEVEVAQFHDSFDSYLKQQEAESKEGAKELRALFAALNPEFEIIWDELGVFARTWGMFRDASRHFGNLMQKLDDVKDFPAMFKVEVTRMRDTATPLQKALDAYAPQAIAEP